MPGRHAYAVLEPRLQVRFSACFCRLLTAYRQRKFSYPGYSLDRLSLLFSGCDRPKSRYRSASSVIA